MPLRSVVLVPDLYLHSMGLTSWVFATANNKGNLLEPIFDRFETYFLTDIQITRIDPLQQIDLGKKGLRMEEFALYIANVVLRGHFGMRSGRFISKCNNF